MKAFLPGIGKVNCYSVKSCTWKEDEDGNWATKCGNLYVTNYGTPRENKMKFCCFCGNKLRQVEYRALLPALKKLDTLVS